MVELLVQLLERRLSRRAARAIPGMETGIERVDFLSLFCCCCYCCVSPIPGMEAGKKECGGLCIGGTKVET